MPVIELHTIINAPAESCFDLSRSIDLHQASLQHTKEKAISGKTSGLIGPGESVTWKARHFGIWFTLTSTITEFKPPQTFVDEMTHGPFVRFRHAHYFEAVPEGTRMTDVFDYTSPLGFLGKLADRLFLNQYMTNLLTTRNDTIRQIAESDQWKDFRNEG